MPIHTIPGHSGLAVACLTAVHEVLGSNRTVGSCVYCKKIPLWFTALGTGCAHLSCSTYINSAFYPPWDGEYQYQLSGWIIIITNGNGGCRRQLPTHSPSQVAWSEGQRPLGAVLHSTNELSELSQWPRSWWQHYKHRHGYYYYARPISAFSPMRITPSG